MCPSPCAASAFSPRGSPPAGRSRGTYFILKMAVSQEQKPCAERRQEGLTSLRAPFSLASATWLSPTKQLGLPRKPGAPPESTKALHSPGMPKKFIAQVFQPLLLPPATTHVVPLVEVDGAGDGGEALVAVVVVGVQGGGDAAMTNLGEREAEGEGERRQLGREPRAPRRPAVNSGQFAPGETEERGQPRRAEGSSKQRPLLG